MWERVVPAMAARQEAMLREQIAIAERHPDLRACLTDQVIFLAGGSRVLPMSSLSRGLTLEQADAMVAQLGTAEAQLPAWPVREKCVCGRSSSSPSR